MSSQSKRQWIHDRREFLRRAAALTGAGAFLGATGIGCGKKSSGGTGGIAATGAVREAVAYDVVLAKNGLAKDLVNAAFDKLGGMGSIVKAGQRVCLKPNAAWARMPGSGACTHPDVLGAVIELLLDAGVEADDIVVFEKTRDAAITAMAWSGVGELCDELGVAVINGTSSAAFQAQPPPENTLYLEPNNEQEEVALELMMADVVINMPVLKQHSATKLSMGIKNLMGAIFNPERYHGTGDANEGGNELDERIADLAILLGQRVTLTLMDATYVLREGGPKGVEGEPGDELNTIILGTDPVAVDAIGAEVYGMAKPMRMPQALTTKRRPRTKRTRRTRRADVDAAIHNSPRAPARAVAVLRRLHSVAGHHGRATACGPSD